VHRQTLRTLLIGSAISIPFLTAFVWWLLGYGPWVGTSVDVSNQRMLFSLMAIQGFCNGVPISALCLWAAHNLKPLSFMSISSLSKYCSIGIFACFLCVVLSVLETVEQFRAFEEELYIGLGELAYTIQYVIYGIANSLVLVFAKYQLKRQLVGEKIQEPALAETFS